MTQNVVSRARSLSPTRAVKKEKPVQVRRTLLCGSCGKFPEMPIQLNCCLALCCLECVLADGYRRARSGNVNGYPWYQAGEVSCCECGTRALPTQQFLLSLSYDLISTFYGDAQDTVKCTSPGCQYTGSYIQVYRHKVPLDIDVDRTCALERIKCPECTHTPICHPGCTETFSRGIPDNPDTWVPRSIRYQDHVLQADGCAHVSCDLCDFAGTYSQSVHCSHAHFTVKSAMHELRSSIWALLVVCDAENEQDVAEFTMLSQSCATLIHSIKKRQLMMSHTRKIDICCWLSEEPVDQLMELANIIPSLDSGCPHAGSMQLKVGSFHHDVRWCIKSKLDALRQRTTSTAPAGLMYFQ